MKKKIYLKPDVKVHQVKPTAILAGSVQQKTSSTEGLGGEETFNWQQEN